MDLVNRLLMDVSQHLSGLDRAAAGNKAYGGSIDAIIGKLEREKKLHESAGRTTQDNIQIAASKGVDLNKLDLANRLNSEVESMRKKAGITDRDAANNMKVVGSLKQLESQLQATKRAQDEFNLSMLRNRNGKAEDINALRAKLMEPKLRELQAAGASPDELRQARQLMLRQQDAQHGLQKGTSQSGKWAGVELARAGEDFIQGSVYGGMKGGVLAASNNISQAMSAYGAYAGIVGSVTSAVLILGITAYDAWTKAQEGAKKGAEWTRNYTSDIDKAVAAQKSLRDIQQDMADAVDPHKMKTFAQAKDKTESIDRDLAKRKSELEDRLKFKQRQDTLLGTQGMTAAEQERASKEVEKIAHNRTVDYWARLGKLTPFAPGVIAGEGMIKYEESKDPLLRQQALRMLEAHEDVKKEGHLDKVRELEKDNAKLATEKLEIEKLQNAVIARRIELHGFERRKTLNDPELLSQRNRWADVRNGFSPDRRTALEQREDEIKNRQDVAKREADRFQSAEQWRKSRGMDLEIVAANAKQMGGGDMLQAQRDFVQNERRIQEMLDKGVITSKDAAGMWDQEAAERDRRMRQAKYGGLTADGSTGFSSMDVKSTGGFNAVLKAMRQDQQQKELTELKKNGEIAEESKAYLKIIAENSKLAPEKMVEFH